MNKEELWKRVDLESDWVRYYGHRPERLNLDMDKISLYDQLVSIGYAKVNTPIDLRCNGYLCYEWKDGMSVKDLVPLNKRRKTEENTFSPMEIWVKLYPEDKEMIYKKINKYEQI